MRTFGKIIRAHFEGRFSKCTLWRQQTENVKKESWKFFFVINDTMIPEVHGLEKLREFCMTNRQTHVALGLEIFPQQRAKNDRVEEHSNRH